MPKEARHTIHERQMSATHEPLLMTKDDEIISYFPPTALHAQKSG